MASFLSHFCHFPGLLETPILDATVTPVSETEKRCCSHRDKLTLLHTAIHRFFGVCRGPEEVYRRAEPLHLLAGLVTAEKGDRMRDDRDSAGSGRYYAAIRRNT